MPAIDPIKAYLDTVCKQIRWKKCHASIASELEGHLLDQRDALVQEGASEAEAITEAIAMMGDPVTVGTQLDRTHRPKPQWSMLILTVLLVLAGAVTQYIALQDPQYRASRYISEWTSLAALACLPVLVIAYFADFTLLAKYPRLLIAGLVLLSIPVFLQPDEFLRSPNIVPGYPELVLYIPMLFPVLFAGFLYTMRGRGYLAVMLSLTVILLLAAIATRFSPFSPSAGIVLIVISGTTLLAITICKSWFKVKKAYALAANAVGALIGLFLWLRFGLMRVFQGWDQVLWVFFPDRAPEGYSYQETLTHTLLKHAVFWGKGNLPEPYQSNSSVYITAHTDQLLTYVIFKIGWVVFAFILALIILFLVKGFMLCLKQRNALGQLAALSVLISFTFQILMYLAFNLGLIMWVPFSLPLVSYGKTAIVINLALTGLMLSVFRTGHATGEHGRLTASSNGQRFLTWENRRLIIDLSKRK